MACATCPACGELPITAVIKEVEPDVWQCPRCHHKWPGTWAVINSATDNPHRFLGQAGDPQADSASGYLDNGPDLLLPAKGN